MDKNRIKVVIIDDHAMLAESLGAWLAKHPDLEFVGRADNGEAGWNLCQSAKPDLAVVDVDMPKVDGLELVKRLVDAMPALRLLTMTGRMDPYTIWRVSQSGVHGYAEKTLSPDQLIEAIRLIAGGKNFFSPLFQKIKQDWLAQPEAFQKILSDREQDILRRVAVGWEDDRIAGQLNITEATVAMHRKNIRKKLELHNDRELIGYARKWGLTAGAGEP